VAAVSQNLTIEQGATFDWTYTPPAIVTLVGATAKAQLRSRTGDLLATFQTSDGTLVLGGAAGTVRFLVPAAVTALFNWADAASYDLFVTLADTTVRKFLAGMVSLVPAVTQ
jgi:hypothetical protein